MSWIEKLKDRWKLKSVGQVVVILIVFACTGSTVLFIKNPIIRLISGGAEMEWWMNVIYLLLILPIYNILLLGYGFIFGQFAFFWKYEQKMLRRLGFRRNAQKE